MLGVFSHLGKPVDDAASGGGVEEAHGCAQDVAEHLLVHDAGGSHAAPGRQHGCKEQEDSCKETMGLVMGETHQLMGDTGPRHPLA